MKQEIRTNCLLPEVHLSVTHDYYHHFRLFVYQPIFTDLLQAKPGLRKVNFWGLLNRIFCRPDPLPVTHPTASKH